MIKKLGTFEVKSGTLRITDPCYSREVWCCGTIQNCEIGKWSGFLIYSDEKKLGIRVAENIAIFGDVSIEQVQKFLDEFRWLESHITVGVDSGQAGIFDDSSYPKSREEIGEYGDPNSFYGKCCDITTNESKGGVLDFGIVSSSGFGDGSYTCLFCYNEDNKIFAVRIIFIDEIDHNIIRRNICRKSTRRKRKKKNLFDWKEKTN